MSVVAGKTQKIIIYEIVNFIQNNAYLNSTKVLRVFHSNDSFYLNRVAEHSQCELRTQNIPIVLKFIKCTKSSVVQKIYFDIPWKIKTCNVRCCFCCCCSARIYARKFFNADPSKTSAILSTYSVCGTHKRCVCVCALCVLFSRIGQKYILLPLLIKKNKVTEQLDFNQQAIGS